MFEPEFLHQVHCPYPCHKRIKFVLNNRLPFLNIIYDILLLENYIIKTQASSNNKICHIIAIKKIPLRPKLQNLPKKKNTHRNSQKQKAEETSFQPLLFQTHDINSTGIKIIKQFYTTSHKEKPNVIGRDRGTEVRSKLTIPAKSVSGARTREMHHPLSIVYTVLVLGPGNNKYQKMTEIDRVSIMQTVNYF